MNEVRDLKWFKFEQNNSGGSFDVDDKVCHRLFIEAESFDDAVEKAEELGCYWHGVASGIDCPCCGDRWDKWNDKPVDIEKYKTEGYKTWRNGIIKFNDIEEYAQYLSNEFGWTTPDARIYYNDGTVKEIFSSRAR